MAFDFFVLDRGNIQTIIAEYFTDAYNLIGQTYLKFFEKKAINPPSYFLRFPDKLDSRIIALPSYINDGSNDIAGIKWISSFPKNIQKGIQRASSVFILNDGETGYPFACLESAYISAFRTACSAVLAAEKLLHENKEKMTLSFIGGGYIARTILEVFMQRQWSFKKIKIYDQNMQYSQNFTKYFDSNCSNLVVASKLEEAIIDSDIITFATTSLQPYINDLYWFDHCPLVLNISLRDLSPDILYKSINYVDDVEHVLQADTSPHLTYQKYNNKEFIHGDMFKLLTQKIHDGILRKKPIIFSPMGMGVLDLVVANFVFEKAKEKKCIKEVPNFFGDILR